MRVMLAGLGSTGSSVARQLRAPEVTEARIFDPEARQVRQAKATMDQSVATIVGPPEPNYRPDVTILATPTGHHVETASMMLEAGSHVVSLSDSPDDVVDLLALDDRAKSLGRSVVVGAGFAPGLSCLLARWAGDSLDHVDAINVAKAGTAGPACARQHHWALKSAGRDWVGEDWETRRGGTGRDLAWFPEPFGAHDCYRGALSSPLLLHRQYPTAERISARMAATRRDRLTSRLPMLRRPHGDGGPGALRVAVHGRRNGAIETVVLGVTDYPSVAAAAVATVVSRAVVLGESPPGASGLAEWEQPGRYLAELRGRGINVAAFTGS